VAVAVTGIIGILAMSSIVPAQAWVGRIGPYRAAPVGLATGTAGCGMGTVAFLTDAWPLLFPASICMGVASGISMTSGLRFVDTLTRPEDRGALTGAFYAAAYAAMTMPLIVATAGRVIGFSAVLATFTGLGVLGSIWLARASRAAAPTGSTDENHRFAGDSGV
jgi:hypothetical protein